ncbi:hypothetical protein EXM90_19195 [Clostridium botulinum]|uniref:hypothetical protein n=1 Tax=Clostridium botulinum TaxID=1491 RepID=UPI0007742C5E|nr:hypothetical protein [Clostridium botulinum]MBN3367260.1 hypothetical protein [Clostridium botulinum]MBN3371644.1 hypothetical protein [Clostridium botulinum]MBN3375550.1 hypothetical protein [Clostridium botulinum]MBN3384207.1 hypothetical protein [Clostridium botulinum]MBN3402828.1 hypothetical protein [Clostridium botulinum]
MKIEKMDLKDGGCLTCNRGKYDYTNNDVKVSYPYDYVYKLQIGNFVHRLCEDCLIELNNTINDVLK